MGLDIFGANEAAHIPGAINQPPELVTSRARKFLSDLAAEIVVYCGSLTCDRAEQVLRALNDWCREGSMAGTIIGNTVSASR